MRGGVSIIGDSCCTSSRVFVRRMTLCGVSAPVLLRGPRISHAVHGRSTHVVRIGPACDAILLTNLARSVTSLFRRLGDFSYLLRCDEDNEVTIAEDFSRPVSSCLGGGSRR